VDTALATRGTIRRTTTANVAALCFEIYDGIDRSETVKLSTLQGHILTPKYLTSNQNLKSVVEMMSGVIEVNDVYRPGESTLSGWRRKTMEFDAGTPEIEAAPAQPDRPKSSATKAQKAAYANAYDDWVDKYNAWKIKKANTIATFRTSQSASALAKMKKEVSENDGQGVRPHRRRKR
jgi:hypothetical protein